MVPLVEELDKVILSISSCVLANSRCGKTIFKCKQKGEKVNLFTETYHILIVQYTALINLSVFYNDNEGSFYQEQYLLYLLSYCLVVQSLNFLKKFLT